MRLDELDVATMRRAIEIYLEHAYPDPARRPRPPIAFETCRSVDDVLAAFRNETGSHRMRKYVLRLGNERYPHMKLVFQELLIRDSFFFAVDTHDELDIKKSYPDYEKWLDLKRQNAQLKEAIEKSWSKAGVPTFASIVREVEERTPRRAAAPGRRPEILIVDDDADIARGVETILDREGYDTRLASSGEEALKAIAEKPPDLVLSDLEMPGMTGLELAEALRAKEDTARIPFILATAATVGSSNFRVIDGYLVKPFDTNVLLKFIEQYLKPARPAS